MWLVYFICKKQHQVPSKLWIMFFDISLLLARLCAKYLKHKAAFFPLKALKSWLKVWVGWYSMCCHISVCDIRQSLRLLNICWALSCSTDLLSPCSTIKMKWSMYQQEGRKHGGMHTSTDASDLAHYLLHHWWAGFVSIKNSELTYGVFYLTELGAALWQTWIS